jgi:hypothetical protein
MRKHEFEGLNVYSRTQAFASALGVNRTRLDVGNGVDGPGRHSWLGNRRTTMEIISNSSAFA